MKYKSPYAGEQTDKGNPHRTAEEIILWAQDHVTDAMTFTPEDFKEKVQKNRVFFTADGWSQYGAYLRDAQLLDAVQNKKYSISTIVNGSATILNHGAVGGTYRWLVEMPIIVSFSQVGSDGESRSITGGKFRLTVQIGRTSSDITKEGLGLETWKAQNAE